MRIPKVCIVHANSANFSNFNGKKKLMSQPKNYSINASLSLDKSKKDSFALSKKK